LLLGDPMHFGSEGQDGEQRFVIAFGPGVTGGRLDVLTDDDDGQQDQLQEGLRNPATIMIGLRDWRAAGSEMSAITANTYAHHMEPTDFVILTPRGY